ncbi:MAG: RNA methyltransferase [Candidatus Aminicenantes bacterium]|nr:RNA methyltransferase [Candidatus Aminicenantes bacterium]
MRTPERLARVNGVLSRRQPDLRVVLEEITNAHNANAVLRTCDAAGVLHVDVIQSGPDPLPINNAVTTRADKWLEIHHHPTPGECYAPLKTAGFQIAATHLGEGAIPYTSLDYSRPTAIVFGNEREGLSVAAREGADVLIKIPMFGMVQSLNLSVSVGIILYEAVRQRFGRGFFESRRLSPEEFEETLDRWLDL